MFVAPGKTFEQVVAETTKIFDPLVLKHQVCYIRNVSDLREWVKKPNNDNMLLVVMLSVVWQKFFVNTFTDPRYPISTMVIDEMQLVRPTHSTWSTLFTLLHTVNRRIGLTAAPNSTMYRQVIPSFLINDPSFHCNATYWKDNVFGVVVPKRGDLENMLLGTPVLKHHIHFVKNEDVFVELYRLFATTPFTTKYHRLMFAHLLSL